MKSLFFHFKAAISLTLMLLNAGFWCSLLFVVALIKFIVIVKSWRLLIDKILIAIAKNFISINCIILRWISWVTLDVNIEGPMDINKSYLVLCNHQSYSDIIIIQKIFNRNIPFLKFFLKQELIWIPVFGQAWWALDFPFMKRYTKAYLKKHPEDAGKDYQTTKEACEKFKGSTVSIMNFVEGTRFTYEKRDRQNSPYQYLLKPKAGGVGYVLGLLQEQIKTYVDVRIYYEIEKLSLWKMLGGWSKSIRVHVEIKEIPQHLFGDPQQDKNLRIQIQQWLNNLWSEKDQWLIQQKQKSSQ